MNSTTPESSTIGMMQDLLRLERAAAVLCEQAMAKVDGSAEQSALQRIFAAHRQAADLLRAHLCHHQIPLPEHVRRLPERDRRAIESATSAEDAIRAVQRVEQRAVAGYRRALGTRSLTPDCRDLIQRFLLPDRERNVDTLVGPDAGEASWQHQPWCPMGLLWQIRDHHHRPRSCGVGVT